MVIKIDRSSGDYDYWYFLRIPISRYSKSTGDAMAIEAGVILSEWDSDTFN